MEEFKGLSQEEVRASREQYGPNIITAKSKVTFWQKYWENFDDPIIKILLIALGVNVVFTFLGKVDWIECAGILLSVLLATFVSTISEFRNESVFQKIQQDASNILCKVYRSGELKEIHINDIVVGDFVLLQAGDVVPADGQVLSGMVKIDQSSLNGENKEVLKVASENKEVHHNKFIDFWDEHIVFRGSTVCSGECVMGISEVGDRSVYGKLTKESQVDDRTSPLMLKLSRLARDISRFGYIGAIAIVFIFMFQHIVIDNGFNSIFINQYLNNIPQVLSDLVEGIILGIIVVVVAVPEGLPLMIAIVCSLNMKKMLKDNILVRKLIGIETAGSLNILFSDKTGTITKGRLEVVKFIRGDNEEYNSYWNIENKLRNIIDLSILGNSSAHLSGNKILGGNATEKALMQYVMQDKNKRININKILETPFSSVNKFSACEVDGDYNLTLIKGAPEIILKKCTAFYDSNGNVCPLNSIYKLDKNITKMANKSIRVLALAVSDQKIKNETIPNDLTLVGLVGIRDDVRPEAKSSISEVQRAGIQVVMITGDKKETAVAIAREAEIITSEYDIVLTSDDLHKMSDDDIKKILAEIRVIARAIPTDKSRLVRIAQEMNLVVGMTGDGVNDTPALKQSDVGFAMGSGTEVAKEAGDIVILDDNFTSIKKAVLYGRTIYNSIKKFIKFQLTINVAAVSVSLIGPIIGIEKPLDITQMLWINLVMDTLAAIAFGGEPALKRYMSENTKSRDENIIDNKMWSSIIVNSFFICILSMIIFTSDSIHIMFREHGDDIYFYTGYFTFFIFTCIFNAFNARVEGIDLIENISINKQFLFIIFGICIVQILMTYLGGAILRTAGLTFNEWIVVLSLAITIIPVDILRKITLK